MVKTTRRARSEALARRGPKTVTLRVAAIALIGRRVRSFDFDGLDITGERACYITGTVAGILKAGDLASDGETVFHDCDRYIIVAESRTFAGKPTPLAVEGQQFFPPLNGTPTFGKRTMNGVVPIIERHSLRDDQGRFYSEEWEVDEDMITTSCDLCSCEIEVSVGATLCARCSRHSRQHGKRLARDSRFIAVYPEGA